MELSAFLRGLFDEGRVKVAALGTPLSADDQITADQELLERDAAQRLEFPGDAPPLAPDVARWAAGAFYRACQFAVYRDAGKDQIAEDLQQLPPPAAPASQHYSVDLVFSFLPELYRLAHATSADDPLCEEILNWGQRWPLSSVGMKCANLHDLVPICEHAGLLRFYADRIVARGDLARLDHPQVRLTVRSAIGHFPALAPQIANLSKQASSQAE